MSAIFTRLPAVAAFALLVLPAAIAPTVTPIQAQFVPAEFATHYTVTAQDENGKQLTYEWRLIPPTGDPGCDHFSATGNTAVWHHGDQDGCNHNVQVAQGHPGTVIVIVSDGDFSCTATYFGTNNGNGPAAACSPLTQATPSAAVPTSQPDSAAHANTALPAWQIAVAILVFLAVAGGVGWFLLGRRDRCDELRDRCRELSAHARAAADRAEAAKAAAASARKTCDDARKGRERAEERLKAASGDGGPWIEGSDHPGERLTSHDLALRQQYEASVRAQLQSGEITEAQAQEMLSHWGNPAQWNRLRKEEKHRAESDLVSAKTAESTACAEADRLQREAETAGRTAAAARKTAAEACAVADECEKTRREQAAQAAAAPPPAAAITPRTPPTPPTTVSPPVAAAPPPQAKTQEKPECDEGETRTEVRCETEVDLYALGEMTLKVDSVMMFSQEDVDRAMSGLEHALVVIDLGTLAVSSLAGAPMAVGAWIAGKAGFPSFDTITSLPQDAALNGLRRLNDIVRQRRSLGTYTLYCNRYHVKARCEVTSECQGGHWVVTSRTMTVEPVGAAQNVPASAIEVQDVREINRAIQKMANYFRGGNSGAQRQLDDCAKKCQG